MKNDKKTPKTRGRNGRTRLFSRHLEKKRKKVLAHHAASRPNIECHTICNMFIYKELRFAFFDFRAIVIALFQDIRVKRMRHVWQVPRNSSQYKGLV